MSRSRAATAARIVLATVGGYVVASTVIALLAAGLPRLTGLARSEAVLLASMLGFIIYLVILLWGFSERSLPRLALRFTGLAICAISLVAIINRYVG
jgi:cytochrome bd-type quinol oxidase subunit 2